MELRTAPVPILIRSGNQVVEGAGEGSTQIRPQTGLQASILPTGSPFVYTNTSRAPQYVRVIHGTETSGSATVGGGLVSPAGILQEYNGATTTPQTGKYLLGPSDSLTVVYPGGGAPTMDSSLPMFAYNTVPLRVSRWRGLEINYGPGVFWGTGLDLAYNPNGVSGIPPTPKRETW